MQEMISTVIRGREILLAWQPEEMRIHQLMQEGFIPIEMAQGDVSFVDSMELDHHNTFSDRPAACVTALRHYGRIPEGTVARFMVNHTDADCVMAGITLLALVDRSIQEELNQDIGRLDIDPLGVDAEELKYGPLIQTWKAGMSSTKQSGWSWLFGMQLFLDLLERPQAYEEYREKLLERDRGRRAQAMQDYETAVIGASGKIAAIPSKVWGFDVQFGRKFEAPSESPSGWRHWCVIAHIENTGAVTLSCPNDRVAEHAFGHGGLLNVYALLPAVNGKLWGGRASVGGSPRGEKIPDEMAPEVMRILENALRTETRA